MRFASFLCVLALSNAAAAAGEVHGTIEMPAACAPAVSPAVVRLESLSASAEPGLKRAPRDVALVVEQKYLQFKPRVTAAQSGETLRFTNSDNEAHNVHIMGAGVNYNRTIAPGETGELKTGRPGLLRLLCDIHIHMRGYVVVSETPWIAVCDRNGGFRINDVPPGRYRLIAWHELGDPLEREVDVLEGPTDLGKLTLEGSAVIATQPGVRAAPVPWPEVIDRISVTTAMALDVASREREKGATRAVSLVDDAYLGIFESTDMETAVRSALGYDRVIAVEEKFRKLRRQARDVANGKVESRAMADAIRTLLSTLVADARELQAKGIPDRSKVFNVAGPGSAATAALAGSAEVDTKAQLVELRRALNVVSDLAEQGESAEAAAEVVTAYFDAFEPIERVLFLRNPSAVQPLEARFATLRGRLDGGLRGEALDLELAAIHQDTIDALDAPGGGGGSIFGISFAAALGTILREGVEIILLLTMLLTLITKAGRPRGATAALWWGVALAVVASAATAVGLNMLVASTRGRSREIVEGIVMLAASGVLFYVSYWLISQSESQKWLGFIKEKARQGTSVGKFVTLGLAAFLAVYREGAETVLMYQALLAGQPREGVAGVVAGTALGLVALAVIAVVLRVTSLKIPLKPFFQITGCILFILAVVFAGNGILELQVAGLLKTTPLSALGRGIPLIGLHPTVQGVAVQGLLVAGGVAALVLLALQKAAGRAGPPVAKNAGPPRPAPVEPSPEAALVARP